MEGSSAAMEVSGVRYTHACIMHIGLSLHPLLYFLVDDMNGRT